jgi:molybdopterin molybdotransferase
MSDLLSVDSALEHILRDIRRLPSETIALDDAHGRTLAEDIIAQHDIPSFANSSMDGFAVRSDDVVSASDESPVRLRVVMDIPAGSAPTGSIEPGEAARIMTGAPLPPGADAVVPVELTDIDWRSGASAPLTETVGIHKSANAGANVRYPGEDVRSGARVLLVGSKIRAAEMGVLAGLGCAQVACVREPRVAILSGGDELLAPGEPLVPGKIRDMNSYSLMALVQEYGAMPLRIPTAKDNLDDIRRRFREALDLKPDMIISSAGVSVGTADLIRTVLDEMGNIGFWKINLRPGKPLAYGHLGGVPFFGLPGNPVSAMITFDVFVRPCLLTLLGAHDLTQITQAVAGEDIRSDGRRTYVRVKLSHEGGQLIARVTGTQSSSAITSMVAADGLLIIPENVTLARAGERFDVRILR